MLMNGTNGNEPGYPENALVPYPVIVAATKGDPDAMKIVLQHFSGYIARLSMRKLYDERGNVYFGVDHDIRERLQAKLMMAVLGIFLYIRGSAGMSPLRATRRQDNRPYRFRKIRPHSAEPQPENRPC